MTIAASPGRLAAPPPIVRAAAVRLTVGLIAAGLVLRLGPWHPPLAIHHVGGGLLWGSMVYALVTIAFPSQAIVRRLASTAAIVIVVEGSRLVHTPWLDAFRDTLPGQLLLGHIFSPLNIVVDGAGAACVAAVLRYCSWYGERPPPPKPKLLRPGVWKP